MGRGTLIAFRLSANNDAEVIFASRIFDPGMRPGLGFDFFGIAFDDTEGGRVYFKDRSGSDLTTDVFKAWGGFDLAQTGAAIEAVAQAHPLIQFYVVNLSEVRRKRAN